MVILLIECPVRRPWVLVDVSCSAREASYINLASDYFERMNMQKYCNISNKWKKLILRGPSSWAMFEWRPYNYYVKIYFCLTSLVKWHALQRMPNSQVYQMYRIFMYAHEFLNLFIPMFAASGNWGHTHWPSTSVYPTT